MNDDRPVARLGVASGPLPRVLLVSPPVAPPWLNGTTLLVRELASSGSAFRYHVLGHRGQASPGGRSIVEPVYGAAGAANGLLARGRVLARLLRPDRCALHHFFFAPHPQASRVARLALTLSRKPSVHTVPSQPAPGADLRRLAFADRTVVLTESSAVHLRSAGVDGVRVVRPAVPLPPQPVDRAESRRRLALACPEASWVGAPDAPLFVYPGDLAFSDGAHTFVEAAARLAEHVPEARFVLACRSKTPAAGRVLTAVRRRVAALGLGDRVVFLGVVPDMRALLGSATAVVLPVDTLYAKVDTPIVLLEALALGVPAVVSDLAPLQELAGLGEGVLLSPRSQPEGVAAHMRSLAESPSLVVRLGQGARRTIAAHFRPDRMALAYEALYRELLS